MIIKWRLYGTAGGLIALVAGMLAALDVAHRGAARVAELSGGEQQRVSIARALRPRAVENSWNFYGLASFNG